MATISENLQIIKDSTDAIKQAIIDKGGTISGNISTWANAINNIQSGDSEASNSIIMRVTYTGNKDTFHVAPECAYIEGTLENLPEYFNGWIGYWRFESESGLNPVNTLYYIEVMSDYESIYNFKWEIWGNPISDIDNNVLNLSNIKFWYKDLKNKIYDVIVIDETV